MQPSPLQLFVLQPVLELLFLKLLSLLQPFLMQPFLHSISFPLNQQLLFPLQLFRLLLWLFLESVLLLSLRLIVPLLPFLLHKFWHVLLLSFLLHA